MYKNYYEVTKLDSSAEWPAEESLVNYCDGGWRQAHGFIRKPRVAISPDVKLVDVFLKRKWELQPRELESTVNV